MTFVAVQDHSFRVRFNSPVDLSGLRQTAVPAGALGRVKRHATLSDKIVETRDPDVPKRFHVASWPLNGGDVTVPSSDAEIEAGVKLLARAGYNAIRIFGPEIYLMSGTTGALNFPADRLDRLDYVMAKCKEHGIYWVLCPKSMELYQDGQGCNRYTGFPASSPKLRGRLYTQKETRDHWLNGLTALWNRANAYTGLNILADPALLMMESNNENSALFWTNHLNSWPPEWSARDSGTTQGTAGLLWPDWLADSAQAHGYADLAALNTSWGTAYASFAAAAASMTGALKSPSTQRDLDACLYTSYLEDIWRAYVHTTLDGLGYSGLRSPMITFSQGHALRLMSRNQRADEVMNCHQYANTQDYALADGISMTIAGNKPAYDLQYVYNVAGAYSCGLPKWLGECGHVAWAMYRYQYPLFHAFAAMNGASGVTNFHQGDIFDDAYSTASNTRTRVMYAYHGTDPVTQFAQTIGFFAFQCGYVSEGEIEVELAINDQDLGLSPRTPARIYRFSSDWMTPLSRIPGLGKTKFSWTTDNAAYNLGPIYYARSLYDWCVLAEAAGQIEADNETFAFATANHGSIVNFDISNPDIPVMQVTSHTLASGDHISIMTLNGSGANWPGINIRQGTITVEPLDATHLQITSSTIALNASTWTGSFTSGTWCEVGNHIQSGTGEIVLSRHSKYVAIDTPKLKFFSCAPGKTIRVMTGMEIRSISDNCALAVSSLDGNDLNTSGAMLVALCGEEKNDGDVYSADQKTLVTCGDYPIVVEQVEAVFRLSVTDTMQYIRPIGLDGIPGDWHPVTVIDSNTIEVAVSTGSSPVMYWELGKRRLRSAGFI